MSGCATSSPPATPATCDGSRLTLRGEDADIDGERARAERLPRFAGVAVLVTAAAAVCWVIGGITGSGDYNPGGAVLGDNAAPAIAALIHVHLAGAAASQP